MADYIDENEIDRMSKIINWPGAKISEIGDLTFEWWNGGRHLTITIYNDGGMVGYSTREKDSAITKWGEINAQYSPYYLFDWLTGHSDDC